jgi:uncharacterized membrane-anchored protein YjiN (DUF445 family)
VSTAQVEARAARLRDMQRVATGLLAAMAALYVASSLGLRQAPWLAYVRAFAEAATVGACADWFAVTALFRRPFGLPIPHTAIIPRNKDRLGAGLGRFIADNFLTADVLEARLQRLEVVRWGAAWLREPRNAAVISARLVKLIPELLERSTPAARRQFIGALAADVIASARAAPLAAGLLRMVWSGENNGPILDAGLDLAAGFVARNQDLIRAEIAGRTYAWLPRWVDEKIAGAVMDGLTATIERMRSPEHPWRERVRQGVDAFIDRLETDPELAAKAGAIKQQIASHPALIDRLADISRVLEDQLSPKSDEEVQALTDRLTGLLARLGAWLHDEAEAVDIFNAWARQVAQRTIAPRRQQIGQFIASVVAAWDVGSLVEKLELQVGPDLQFIRINGTIVGGLAGLAIYTVSQWCGLQR